MSEAARLDRRTAAPETADLSEGGGAAGVAVEIVTEDAAPAAVTPADALVEKARAVAQKVQRLRRELTAAKAFGQQAQIREALTRTELTAALNASMGARAELAARLRALALAGFLGRARAAPRVGRRHNRLSRALDKALARLGSFGQALVIARSGVWRGTGRPLHDLRHMAAYARRRAEPTVVPPTLLDQAWYLAANPDVAAGRTAPLTHYLLTGAREGRSPGPLFDEGHYRRQNAAELADSGVSALEHYLRTGWARARNPHPLFDIAHYVSQAPDLAEEPLAHYLRDGWRQGLSPHPLFDPAWYLARAPRTAAGAPPLAHYLREGWREGLSPHPLFDPAWYLEQHPDVAAAGDEPLTHFVVSGALEGRSPSPWFDLAHYVARRGAALAPEANPLVDYLQGGAWAVAEARPGFPTAAYLAGRPELVQAGLTPLEHWARRGGR